MNSRIQLRSRLSVREMLSRLRAAKHSMGKVIGEDIAWHIRHGMNIDGGMLHVPERLVGSKKANKPMTKKQWAKTGWQITGRAGQGNRGGPGVDTGTMIAMIKRMMTRSTVKRIPAFSRRGGVAITFGVGGFAGGAINPISGRSARQYVYEYEEDWANGRILGISARARGQIIGKIRRAIKAY